jgi:hypothetical protein
MHSLDPTESLVSSTVQVESSIENVIGLAPSVDT